MEKHRCWCENCDWEAEILASPDEQFEALAKRVWAKHLIEAKNCDTGDEEVNAIGPVFDKVSLEVMAAERFERLALQKNYGGPLHRHRQD